MQLKQTILFLSMLKHVSEITSLNFHLKRFLILLFQSISIIIIFDNQVKTWVNIQNMNKNKVL